MSLSDLLFWEGAVMNRSKFEIHSSKTKNDTQNENHREDLCLDELKIVIKGAGEMASGNR